MRPKSLALLLLALGCALVASIGITEVLSRGEPAGPTGDTQPIFVAMTDIGLGDLITPEVLKLEQWPKDKIQRGAISLIEDIEGRRARTKIYADEPILENRLLGKGASEQGATALIPKGYRVVPVKVNLVSGGSSLILPGDRVDVMVHLVRNPGRDIPETVTRTILQDIKVFAVDDVVDLEHEKDSSGKSIAAKTISLLVTPNQAAKVMLATHMGTINLVMRSPEDDEQIANAQARPGELFGGQSKSDRDKESLMSEGSGLNEKTQGFLDFLNTRKGKSTGAAAAAQPQPPGTWIMRLLKPGDVEDVEFETEAANSAETSPIGFWKTMTMAANSGDVKTDEEEPTTTVMPPDSDDGPAMEPP